MCYVGISFGPVFTASIGGERREFMLVGDVVNTAGKLSSTSLARAALIGKYFFPDFPPLFFVNKNRKHRDFLPKSEN